jgi:hypothetical protein
LPEAAAVAFEWHERQLFESIGAIVPLKVTLIVSHAEFSDGYNASSLS